MERVEDGTLCFMDDKPVVEVPGSYRMYDNEGRLVVDGREKVGETPKKVLTKLRQASLRDKAKDLVDLCNEAADMLQEYDRTLRAVEKERNEFKTLLRHSEEQNGRLKVIITERDQENDRLAAKLMDSGINPEKYENFLKNSVDTSAQP